jgi:HD-GYP domain-containing protein (c-di-GMP phosphodiesterase class II)
VNSKSGARTANSWTWPYRPALGIDRALEEITRNRGKLYDPEAVDACIKLFNEKGFTLE